MTEPKRKGVLVKFTLPELRRLDACLGTHDRSSWIRARLQEAVERHEKREARELERAQAAIERRRQELADGRW